MPPMYKKHNALLTALLLVSSFEVGAVQIGGIPATYPLAKDDYISTVIGLYITAEGNVSSNDLNGSVFSIDGSWRGQYGMITSFDSSGEYTYELFASTDATSLPDSGVGIDSFTYTIANERGQTDSARLIIDVTLDPIFSQQSDDELYDNVDVEFNNRSAQAVSLISGRNIKGHLYNSSDKDWYSIGSAGNEIITIEVCPKGTSCFDKKSWVLYVFDSKELAKHDYIDEADGSKGNSMEEHNFQYSRWIDETGTNRDLSGQEVISGSAGSSNHMYLNYRTGAFEGALIGIVDPCFDKLNTVDIGVGDGARDYLIAISSPLLGDGNSGTDESECGAGSVVLEDEGRSAVGLDAEGKTKTYSTTEQGAIVFPNSDDQYTIKVTGTGLNPLQSETALERAAIYDTEQLLIPSVRIGKTAYQATLDKQDQGARSAESPLKFVLADIEALSVDQVVDAYRATYNPENQQVLIPRVTDTETGIGYSVILQYHAASEGSNAWFDLVSATEIQ